MIYFLIIHIKYVSKHTEKVKTFNNLNRTDSGIFLHQMLPCDPFLDTLYESWG